MGLPLRRLHEDSAIDSGGAHQGCLSLLGLSTESGRGTSRKSCFSCYFERRREISLETGGGRGIRYLLGGLDAGSFLLGELQADVGTGVMGEMGGMGFGLWYYGGCWVRDRSVGQQMGDGGSE